MENIVFIVRNRQGTTYTRALWTIDAIEVTDDPAQTFADLRRSEIIQNSDQLLSSESRLPFGSAHGRAEVSDERFEYKALDCKRWDSSAGIN